MKFFKFSSLFALIRGKGFSLILLYLLVIGSTAMESVGIASFYPITEMFQDPSQLDYYRDKLVVWIPELEILDREQFLFYSLIAMAALFIFKNAFLILAGYGNISVITNLYCSWMNKIFKIYLNKPYSYFCENKAGDLVQRKIMQTQKASQCLNYSVQLLASLTNMFGVFLVLCFTNLKVTLIIILFMMPVYYFTMQYSQRKVYTSGNRIVELEKQGFGLTTELLLGIKQIKIFCAENHFQNQIRKIWDEFSLHSIKVQFKNTLPRPIIETLVVLSGVGALIIFGNIAEHGKEIFPLLAVFAVGMYRILPLAAGASSQAMLIASVLPSSEIVASLLRDQIKKEKSLTLSPMADKIQLQNVSFSYDNRELVLKEISLTFKKNKSYGIVGVSGSGKSTIIDLITGFLKPNKGKVLIDGVDLNDVDISKWLCQTGLISQDVFIYSGTVEDNICFGIGTEDRNKDRIKEAARIAYVDEFISLLPEGYQTKIGENGVKLSGGQRQRLAIARAIYLDPPLLIFDEATSSLDANSEKKILDAIDSLHGKRTVIIVAHRLATAASADYIYVINNGNLTEEGTHEKLKCGNGLYNQLFQKQSVG